jgi:DNA-binding LytR/AlgR family response regulator
MRVGKRFIVNLDYIYSVNMAKQCLILSDMEHFAYQLPISKEALRQMKELMIKVKM